MLNSELFPPNIEYTLNTNYGDENKSYRKQVKITIGLDIFAVVNSDFSIIDNVYKWSEPVFVILRSNMTMNEIDALKDISTNVKCIMQFMPTHTKQQMADLVHLYNISQ